MLARKIAQLRVDGVPWDGAGGIVDTMRLVSSATQGRELLREYSLDARRGGPVEIRSSYDRYEINPATGRRKGQRERAQRSRGSPARAAVSLPMVPASERADAGEGGKRGTLARVRESGSGGRAPTPPADPLVNLARRIARETDRQVPTPNPEGPTTRALALFVLRDPGATATSGANETNVLDPFLNRDPTSVRQQAALRDAKLDPDVCVWWNASPYHLGYTGMIRDDDCASGALNLREFVNLCPDLRVVVAMGAGAEAVARRAWSDSAPGSPRLIFAPHPMIYGRGGAERTVRLAACLHEAAELLRTR